MKKEILLRSFKNSEERSWKLVQDFPGAGNKLKSLDVQSWKVFVLSSALFFKIHLILSVSPSVF